MITISTYTEPVPVNPVSVEPPRALEDEESGEASGFEELLAGLLQNTEKTQTDVPPVNIEGTEINIDAFLDNDVFSAAELIDGQEMSSLFGDFEKSEKIDKPEISGFEIPQEQTIALAGNALNGAVEFDLENHEISVGFETETINPKAALNSRDAEPQNNLSNSSLSKKDFSEPVSQTAAAVKNENLSDEKAGKKESLSNDRIQKEVSKNENVEAVITKNRQNAENSNLQNRAENDNRNIADGTRSRSRRDRVSFEVRDFRTTDTNTQNRSFSVVETSAGRVSGESPVREITLELRLPDQNSGSTANSTAQTNWEVKSGAAMENMLARELHQNFNGDIVRHASMALHDGGAGTIRIALKPENLGNVKIQLEMTENKITGHIVVESAEALNAFRKELSALEQAFRDAGFDNASLNLSLTADGQNAEWQEQEPNSFTPKMAASRYDDLFERDVSIVDVFIGQKSGSINLLA